MKCKICGYPIIDGQEVCDGCGTSIEQLKKDGNIAVDVSSQPVYIEEKNQENLVTDSSVVEEAPVEETTAEDKIVETPEDVPAEDKIVETPEDVPAEDKIVETPEDVPTEDKIVETPVVPTVEPTPVETTEQPVIPTVEPTPMESTTVEPNPETVEPTKLEDVVVPPIDSVDEKKPEETEEEKPKKKGKAGVTILIVILVIILLLAGAAAYIHFVFGSPINTFSRVVNGTSTQLSNKVNDFNSANDLTANVSFKSGDEADEFLNGLKVSANLKVDTAKRGLVLDATLENKDQSSNYNLVLLDDNLYIYSKDLIDKYIKLDSLKKDDEENTTNENSNPLVQKEAISRLIKSVANSVSKSVDKSLLKKTYSKETINGKEQEVAVITSSLTKEQLKQIYNNILTSIKVDDQAVKDLSLLTNQTEQQVKENIDKTLSDIDISIDTLNLTIYTDLTTTKTYKVEVNTQSGTYKDFYTYEVKDNGYVLDIKNSSSGVAVTLNTTDKLLSIKSTQEESVDVEIKYDFKKADKVTYPDLTAAIDTDTMTEEDKTIIMTNMSKSPLFSLILGNMETKAEEDEKYNDVKNAVENDNLDSLEKYDNKTNSTTNNQSNTSPKEDSIKEDNIGDIENSTVDSNNNALTE